MNIRYNFDEDTGLPHIYAHGITEDEVEEILGRRHYDRPGSGDMRIAHGQTRAGPYLKVMYVPDEDRRGVFIVTAYPLIGKQLDAYRRWARGRGR